MSVTRADREASLKKRYAGRVAAAPKRRGMGRGPGPGAPRGGGRPKSTGAALKRLLSYLEADRLRMGIAFFCVIVNTVATLTGSYMLRPIINRFIAPPDGSPGDVAGLFKGLTVMACVYLLGVIANYLQSRLMLEVAQSALVRIRTDLFTKMQKLPVRFYDTNSNGDLMSRFTNDVDTIGNMLSSTLVQLFSGTLSIIGTLFLMLYTNIWLTAVTLIMIPLMLRAGGEVAKRSQKYFSAQQSALGALNGYIEETITGQKVVKVFCHEEIAVEEFDILNRDLREKQIRAQFLGGMMGPVMNNLSQINYSLTACIGGILCVVKNFDVGGLTVFLNFSRQFSRPINEISMQVSNVFSALAGAERVFSVMDEEPEAADDKDAVSMDGMRGEVVLDHVTFGYNPDKVILKAPREPERLRSRTSSTVFTISRAGPSPSTALISAILSGTSCAATLPWCFRIRICLREQLWKISGTDGLMPPTRRSCRRRRWHLPIPLSCVFQRAMTRFLRAMART